MKHFMTNARVATLAVVIGASLLSCETPQSLPPDPVPVKVEPEPESAALRGAPIAPRPPTARPASKPSKVQPIAPAAPRPPAAASGSERAGPAKSGSAKSGSVKSGAGNAGTGSGGKGTSSSSGTGAGAKASAAGTGDGTAGAGAPPEQSPGVANPAAGSQSPSRGEVDPSTNRKDGSDFFGESKPANSGGGESLDFEEVAPTDAPLPEAKTSGEAKIPAKLVLPFRGSWRQLDSESMNEADFSFGGYSQRYLAFNEGMGEVRVYSGFGIPIKQVIAIRYRFISKGDGRIAIEPAPGSAASLELVPTGAIQPSSTSALVTWSLTPDAATMTLSGRTYARVSDDECRAFASGEKQRANTTTTVPTLLGVPWVEGDTLVIFDTGQPAGKSQRALSALRNSLKEQFRLRRILIISLNSTAPLPWSLAGTSPAMQQIADAEAAGLSPLSPVRLDDLLRVVGSSPTRIVIVVGSGVSAKECAELIRKREWTCPVDVILTESVAEGIDSAEWRTFAKATGGRAIP